MPIHAGGLCALDILHKGVRCHGKNGDGPAVFSRKGAYGSGRLIPVHLRHLNIHQDQGIVSRPAFTKEPDCLYSIYRCIQLQAESFQKFHGNFTVYFIILSQQDRDPGKIKGFRCLLCRFCIKQVPFDTVMNGGVVKRPVQKSAYS